MNDLRLKTLNLLGLSPKGSNENLQLVLKKSLDNPLLIPITNTMRSRRRQTKPTLRKSLEPKCKLLDEPKTNTTSSKGQLKNHNVALACLPFRSSSTSKNQRSCHRTPPNTNYPWRYKFSRVRTEESAELVIRNMLDEDTYKEQAKVDVFAQWKKMQKQREKNKETMKAKEGHTVSGNTTLYQLRRIHFTNKILAERLFEGHSTKGHLRECEEKTTKPTVHDLSF